MLTENFDIMTIWNAESESPTSVYSYFNTPTNTVNVEFTLKAKMNSV